MDVVYGVAGRELHCDVYRPEPGHANRAAVILLHGGGWRGGSRAMMKDAATCFAQRGFLAVAPEYRLTGEAPWPAQIHDVKTAIRWLRSSAAEFDITAEMLALCGFSAGAHLSLLAAGTADGDAFRVGGSHADVAERVAAVAAFFPPIRLEGGSARNLGVSGDEAKLGSPIAHVSGSFPPTLLLHGTGDVTVPHAHSVAMFEALAASGAPVDLRLYAGLPHEFVRLPGMLDLCVTDIDAFLTRNLLNREAFEAELAEQRRIWEERAQALRANPSS
jgi:acetyl esterase/lipase